MIGLNKGLGFRGLGVNLPTTYRPFGEDAVGGGGSSGGMKRIVGYSYTISHFRNTSKQKKRYESPAYP